jgi:hypothetical protein
VKLIEEEDLDFSVDLIAYFWDKSKHLDLEGLYLDILKYPAFLIPYSVNKLKRSQVISAKLTNSFWQILL